jgi:hypothetical protein
MKNKLGMEIMGLGIATTIDGELVMLHIDENEVIENVNDETKYNDLYCKITRLDNIRKVVANHYAGCVCEYTKEELLTISDEEFISFMFIGIQHIAEDYYKFLIRTEECTFEYWEDYKSFKSVSKPKNKRKLKQNGSFDIDDENKHLSGIYIIKNNNEVYIGQSQNLYNRFCAHFYNNKSTTNANRILKEGGIFKLLEVEEDREKRLIKEKEYVNKYIMEGYEVLNSTKVLFNGSNKAIKKKRLEEPKMGITFNKSDLDKITKLLLDNNINFKPHKFRDKLEEK